MTGQARADSPATSMSISRSIACSSVKGWLCFGMKSIGAMMCVVNDYSAMEA